MGEGLNMKQIIKLIIWRFTGYRKLSKLLHAHFGYNNTLTPIELDEAEVLAREEARLLPIGRKRTLIERILFR